MELSRESVFSPICKCPACGREMLLEVVGDTLRAENVHARCWNCGHSRKLDMEFVEEYIQERMDVQTWRSEYACDELPNGFIITGSGLYATFDEIESLFGSARRGDEKADERLRQIRDREEGICYRLVQNDLDGAYHLASKPHTPCGYNDDHSPHECKENVNFIVTSPDTLLGEHFVLYGFILLAWRHFVDLLVAKRLNVANEEEVRYQLLKQLEKHNEYGYVIEPWMERFIVVSKPGEKKKKAKPDIQFEWQIVIELKAFMEGSEYSLAGAKKELSADFDQMHKYEGKFAAGFVLCVSNKFNRSDLIPDGIPRFNYPVRVEISATLPE